MSKPTATTMIAKPNQSTAKLGQRLTKVIPRPNPKRLCIIACGVKHSFIFLSIFITNHPLLVNTKDTIKVPAINPTHVSPTCSVSQSSLFSTSRSDLPTKT